VSRVGIVVLCGIKRKHVAFTFTFAPPPRDDANSGDVSQTDDVLRREWCSRRNDGDVS